MQRKAKKLIAVEPNAQGKYQCPDCDHTPYNTAKGLASHRGSSHGYVSPFRNLYAKYKKAANRKPGRPRKGKFPCPKCPRSFERLSWLGRHMQAQHGIKGKSKKAQRDRLLKDANAEAKYLAQSRERSASSNGNFNIEQAIAFWISQTCADFKQSCAINSVRVDLTAEEFGSRCLAVLSGRSATLRQLYRLPD